MWPLIWPLTQTDVTSDHPSIPPAQVNKLRDHVLTPVTSGQQIGSASAENQVSGHIFLLAPFCFFILSSFLRSVLSF